MRYLGLPTPRAPDAPVLVQPGYSRRAVSPSIPVAPSKIMPDNNILEQDHRNVKRLTRPGLGFGGFWTTRQTLAGYEAMAMMRKGQVRNIIGSDIRAQATFIAGLFQVAA
jgi:transposase-like protein